MNRTENFIKVIQIAIPFLWSGLLIGLSFIEAPLKFRAPGITRSLGLGIGRLVFGVLNRIEIALCLLLIAAIVSQGKGGLALELIGGLAALLALQTLWLRPVLNARATSIINGETPATTYHHVLFIILESVKVILTLWLGEFFIQQHLK